MLTFTNAGTLDVRAITTFGLNVKTGPTPIGHFGTGLKYAIAVVLRLKGKIAIRIRKEDSTVVVYNFTTALETVRGKEFSFVHMETARKNGYNDTLPLGFTTELGKNWAPWMAYRELRSNMLDENGSMEKDIHISAPKTEIIVDCAELETAHDDVGQYFLETSPLWANADLEIHPARKDGAIFYRGIRVAQCVQTTSCYTYNILHEEKLTEDRTLDLWVCSYRITHAVALLDNAEIAETILLAPPETYEAALTFGFIDEFSPEMRLAIKLQAHNHALNGNAKRRARELYLADFMPRALPMTLAQIIKITQAHELFEAFAINVAWADIRIGEMPEEEIGFTILADKILWLSSATLDDQNWLHYILKQRWINQPWSLLRAEIELLLIMKQARPELNVFKPKE